MCDQCDPEFMARKKKAIENFLNTPTENYYTKTCDICDKPIQTGDNVYIDDSTAIHMSCIKKVVERIAPKIKSTNYALTLNRFMVIYFVP